MWVILSFSFQLIEFHFQFQFKVSPEPMVCAHQFNQWLVSAWMLSAVRLLLDCSLSCSSLRKSHSNIYLGQKSTKFQFENAENGWNDGNGRRRCSRRRMWMGQLFPNAKPKAGTDQHRKFFPPFAFKQFILFLIFRLLSANRSRFQNRIQFSLLLCSSQWMVF